MQAFSFIQHSRNTAQQEYFEQFSAMNEKYVYHLKKTHVKTTRQPKNMALKEKAGLKILRRK